MSPAGDGYVELRIAFVRDHLNMIETQIGTGQIARFLRAFGEKMPQNSGELKPGEDSIYPLNASWLLRYSEILPRRAIAVEKNPFKFRLL
jgi:hypothetical protein